MIPMVAFLDCETTTLNRDRAEAWEVGLILPEGYEHRWFLPVTVAQADPISLDIGGYHERHPNGNAYEPPTEGLINGFDHGLTGTGKFAQFFVQLTHGLHLAGAVLDYDTGILGGLIRAAGHHPSWHYHLIDVENQAAGFIIGREVDYDHATGARRWREGYSEKLVEVATPPYDSEELSEAVRRPPHPIRPAYRHRGLPVGTGHLRGHRPLAPTNAVTEPPRLRVGRPPFR